MQTTIPFRLTAGGPLVVVPTWVNARGPYAFLLDTGAAETLVTVDLAQQLGLASKARLEATHAAGTMPIFPSRLASLAVGAAHATGVAVWIADLTLLRQATAAPLVGQLGARFLSRFRVTIDYPRALLHLTQGVDPGAKRRDDGWTRVPFCRLDRTRPLVLLPTLINGQGPYTFLLDTGASMLVLAPSLAHTLRLQAHAEESLMGAAGQTRGWISRLDTIAVGRAERCQLPVLVADIFAALSEDVGARVEGVLGYPYLQAFQVTLDYRAAVALLRASSAAKQGSASCGPAEGMGQRGGAKPGRAQRVVCPDTDRQQA